MSLLKSSLVTSLALLPILAFSEGMSDAEKDKVSKGVTKPCSKYDLNIRPNDSTQNVLNIQPVWPFEFISDLSQNSIKRSLFFTHNF